MLGWARQLRPPCSWQQLRQRSQAAGVAVWLAAAVLAALAQHSEASRPCSGPRRSHPAALGFWGREAGTRGFRSKV